MRNMGKKVAVRFRLEKETKGTFRFTEVEVDGQATIVGTLYVRKWVVPSGVKELDVTIEFNEPTSV